MIRPEVTAVITELRAQWPQRFRLTTIPQAMERLGIREDAELRWAIGAHLLEHPEENDPLKRWGLSPLLLRDDEKLLARYLQRHVGPGRSKRLDIGPVASTLEITTETASTGLVMLARLGLCRWQPSPTGDRGRLTWYKRASQRAGELGFNFHTVTLVDSGERFGVP